MDVDKQLLVGDVVEKLHNLLGDLTELPANEEKLIRVIDTKHDIQGYVVQRTGACELTMTELHIAGRKGLRFMFRKPMDVWESPWVENPNVYNHLTLANTLLEEEEKYHKSRSM